MFQQKKNIKTRWMSILQVLVIAVVLLLMTLPSLVGLDNRMDYVFCTEGDYLTGSEGSMCLYPHWQGHVSFAIIALPTMILCVTTAFQAMGYWSRLRFLTIRLWITCLFLTSLLYTGYYSQRWLNTVYDVFLLIPCFTVIWLPIYLQKRAKNFNY
jgi:hypothetical protein